MRATKNLVDAMLAATPNPATLVSQSAIGVYGDHGEAIVDESTPTGEGFLAEVVIEWETEAAKAEDGGVRVVQRSAPAWCLDPDGGLLKQLVPPFKLGVGGPLAGGDFYMPWIHRDDEVGLILWALDNADGERRHQRDRSQPGHQPRVLEGARARRCTALRWSRRRVSRSSRCAARSWPSRSPAASG